MHERLPVHERGPRRLDPVLLQRSLKFTSVKRVAAGSDPLRVCISSHGPFSCTRPLSRTSDTFQIECKARGTWQNVWLGSVARAAPQGGRWVVAFSKTA